MKSKQTTEKIQKIITDQKELATRLATALLAVATIGGGTVALSSCDEIELPKNLLQHQAQNKPKSNYLNFIIF